MTVVSLADVLEAKENRARLREQIRQTFGLPVLTFSVNCPGPEKDSPDIRRLLRFAVGAFADKAAVCQIRSREERFVFDPAGPFALVAVDGDPELSKRLAVAIEDLPDYGRLLDVDVYDGTGRPLSRSALRLPPRACFLCANDAVSCMREARHTLDALRCEFQRRLDVFKNRSPWPAEVWEISRRAVEAMLLEAACTPAPGLVDRVNSGAHHDMDFLTFMSSTSAIAATMTRCAAAGWNHDGPPAGLLPQLRRIGREGEQKMFHATRGVNTQKGLIFLMGLLCAATAVIWRRQEVQPSAHEICAMVAALCTDIVNRELSPLLERLPARPVTSGERLYLDHRATGIRGETERGLPSVLQHGLPCLREALDRGLYLNDALVQTLLRLMTVVEDTTVLHRHDPATLAEVQQKAASILDLGGMYTQEGAAAVMQLDLEFIRRWISPGGVADLLAATYFLHRMETDPFPQPSSVS